MVTPDALPPEAVTAAGNALRQQWLTDRPGVYHVDLDPMHWAAVALEAAAPHLAAAERERLYAELGNDHYVIFTEDRWTLEHSVECRLSGHMSECGYHAAIARIAADYDPDMAGRWRIDGIDSEGLPTLTRKDDHAAA